MKIKIINKSKNSLPAYQTLMAAGMDIRAKLEKQIILKPLERKIIPTGLFLEIETGYEAQIRPRSGMAYKYGITVLNAPGTIDADYRGEIKVLLINLSDKDFYIDNGHRIAQMVVAKHEVVQWEEVKEISITKRNTEGYGHTGK